MVHIDKVMLDEVDVTVDDMSGCVIADITNSIDDEVDCVVDDMLSGVVADVNNTVQVGVECVVANMLGGIVKDVEPSEVGSACSLACHLCLLLHAV